MQHYVFTWDLKRNCECHMHAFKVSAQIPYVYISRGVTQRENYFIPLADNHIYDLRFQFPLNFFRGSEANRGHPKLDFKEKQFKRDFDSYNDFILARVAEYH